MKLSTLALAALLVSAMPALANQCPAMMKQFEEALATSTVDDATKAEATALYEKGKAEHDAGDHAASEADLAAALELINA